MPLVLRPPSDDVVPLTDRLGRLGRSRWRVGVATGVLRLAAVTLGLTAAACALELVDDLDVVLNGLGQHHAATNNPVRYITSSPAANPAT